MLTSVRDDSVGGDTNGDGSATGPARGDWAGIYSAPSGSGLGVPTMKLDHVEVHYAQGAIGANGSAVSITNSVVDRSGGTGIDVNGPDGIPTIKGNTITNSTGPAINVTGASLDMGLLDGNSGSGNGLNGVQLTNDIVTVSSALPWTGTLIPVVASGCNALTVPTGVTLTLGAGTTMKAQANGCAYINVQGKLIAHGTAASPVTLTSWRDDSVAGDTNGDGSATGPQRGDWGGISASSGGNGNANPMVDLDHVALRYGTSGVTTSSTKTSIMNSSVDRMTGDGINVGSPDGIPTVKSNMVTNAGGTAIAINNAGIDMGVLDGNSGSGNGLNGVQLSGDTLAVNSGLPWTGTLVPVLYSGCTALTIPAGVTLTLGAGTIVKSQANGCAYFNVQGTVLGRGTAAQPVTLTSWRDDSVGGDTNGDGAATGPLPGDWGGLYASPAGNGNAKPTVDLDHVVERYAVAGISLTNAKTSVTNSTIDRSSGGGIAVNAPDGLPTIKGNTITRSGGTAVSVVSSSIDMGLLDGNSGSGNGLNGIQLSGDIVTVSSKLPWTGTLVPVLYSGCTALTVAPGVTLTLDAGTVVKAQATGCSYISIQGKLVARGTAAKPVTLTSWRDDAVAGDTNADGVATGPSRGDWGGISAGPAGNGNDTATLDLDHVVVRYAGSSVFAGSTKTSITNSLIEHAVGDGISVNSSDGIPTIKGNTVNDVTGAAITVNSSGIDMGSLDGNSGAGDGLNGVQLMGDTVVVSSALPWSGNLVPVLYSGCTALTVPAGVTLTLGAGAVVKAQSNNCAYMAVQGKLVGRGTGASPVVLTSWRDDTAGGDTNGDGDATGPMPGDWGGVYSQPDGNGNPNPTVDLDHVALRYASTGLSLSTTKTSVTASSVDKVAGYGIFVNAPDGIPTIKNNTITHAAGDAVYIAGASLDMGALDGNSGSGNGLNGVRLTGDAVVVSSSLPWSGNLVPALYGGCTTFRVVPKVTLTLGPGTVIKASDCATLTVEGVLNGSGTAANPAVLTSLKDDTVGGDTNGDGDASSPTAGDWGGIAASPAGNGNANPEIHLDQVVVRYAMNGVAATQAQVTVAKSTVSKIAGDGISVINAVGTPAIEGNTISDVVGMPITVRGSSIDLDALDGNVGTGDRVKGVVLSGDVVGVSSGLPWAGDFVPILSGSCDALTIPDGVTVTLSAGTLVKAESCATIAVSGSLIGAGAGAAASRATDTVALQVDGAARQLVSLTSLADDSVGGDTNGDIGNSQPQAGDWGGIRVLIGGDALLDGTRVGYASIGLDVDPQAAAEIHGQVINSTVGVRSVSSFVDASDVDWGDSSGPSPLGTGTPIEGEGVFLASWVGMPAPPDPEPEQPIVAGDSPPAADHCPDIQLVTVRGSGEDPQGEAPDYGFDPAPDSGHSDKLIASDHAGGRSYDMFWGFRKQLEGDTGETVEAVALKYRALGVFYLGVPNEYFTSIDDGVKQLVSYLTRPRCSSNIKVALAGYSQGALVIHLALRRLERQGRTDLLRRSKLAAVMLLADAGKVPNGDELTWEAPQQVAGKGVTKAEGIWRYGRLNGSHRDSGPLPAAVVDRTIAYCRNHDIVCAPGQLRYVLSAVGLGTLGVGLAAWSDKSVHTGYVPTDLNQVGKRAAELYETS